MSCKIKGVVISVLASVILLCMGFFASAYGSDDYAETSRIGIAEARADTSKNLIDGMTESSDNLRNAVNYSIDYSNGTYVVAAKSTWERSMNFLFSDELDALRVIKGNSVKMANEVSVYMSYTFKYTYAGEYQNAGLALGKRENGNITTYYGMNWEPGRGYFGVYIFDVDENGNVVNERSGPLSYTQFACEKNKEYKIELLLQPYHGLSLYLDEHTVVEDLKEVYECKESLLGITPKTGLSWSSLTGILSNITYKYLDGYQPYIDYFATRKSKANNLIGLADIKTKDVFVDGEIKKDVKNNKLYVDAVAGECLIFVDNEYLSNEYIKKNGEKVSPDKVKTLVGARFKYYETNASGFLGFMFAKKQIGDKEYYFGVAIDIVGKRLYYIKNEKGRSITRIEVKALDYAIESEEVFLLEVFIDPDLGISVYLDGNECVVNDTEIDGASVVGVVPVFGFYVKDLYATAGKISLKRALIDRIVVEKNEEQETYPEKPDYEYNVEDVMPKVDLPTEKKGCGAVTISGFACLTLCLISAAIIKRRK